MSLFPFSIRSLKPDVKTADSSFRRSTRDYDLEFVSPNLLRGFQIGKDQQFDVVAIIIQREAMKVRRKRRAASPQRRSPGRQTAAAKHAVARRGKPPSLLHHVEESTLKDLSRGEVWLIEQEASSAARDAAPAFYAVLGCPLCGTPTLITLEQYCGVSPVMCRSTTCAGLFRIADQNRFVYLPVN